VVHLSGHGLQVRPGPAGGDLIPADHEDQPALDGVPRAAAHRRVQDTDVPPGRLGAEPPHERWRDHAVHGHDPAGAQAGQDPVHLLPIGHAHADDVGLPAKPGIGGAGGSPVLHEPLQRPGPRLTHGYRQPGTDEADRHPLAHLTQADKPDACHRCQASTDDGDIRRGSPPATLCSGEQPS
jgi:hypothetical protein